MKLRLLRSAIDDLAEGRSFYHLQQPGIGDYFSKAFFRISNPSLPRQEFIPCTLAFIAHLLRDFLTPES